MPGSWPSLEVVGYEAPRTVRWRQEDENGVFAITYRVEPSAAGARFTHQADEIAWKVPRPVGAVAERLFVRRHIAGQMRTLKQLLENGT